MTMRLNGTQGKVLILPPGTEAKVVRWYQEGVSWREISRRARVNHGTIARILKNHGVVGQRKQLDLIKRIHRQMAEKAT